MLTGFAHPASRSGRYSKDVPNRLISRYEEALSDPEILAMNDEIALIDSRLSDLIARVDSGESGALWQALAATWKQFVDAQSRRDINTMTVKINRIGELITAGDSDYSNWREISILLESRRKLTETERDRRVEMQQVITVEQATQMVSRLVDILRRNISDRRLLSDISLEIRSMMNIGAPASEPVPASVAGPEPEPVPAPAPATGPEPAAEAGTSENLTNDDPLEIPF